MTAATDVPTRHRFTVEEYYLLWEREVLPADLRTELIEGEIIEMAPIGPPHAGGVGLLTHRLVMACGDAGMVHPGLPVRLSNWSEPRPDFSILRPRDDWYRMSHPGPEDVLLVLEVAQTSLRFDREVKGTLYAKHAIPEYWIVNLPESRLEVLTDPVAEGDRHRYRKLEVDERPGTRALRAEPSIRVDLSGLF